MGKCLSATLALPFRGVGQRTPKSDEVKKREQKLKTNIEKGNGSHVYTLTELVAEEN